MVQSYMGISMRLHALYNFFQICQMWVTVYTDNVFKEESLRNKYYWKWKYLLFPSIKKMAYKIPTVPLKGPYIFCIFFFLQRSLRGSVNTSLRDKKYNFSKGYIPVTQEVWKIISISFHNCFFFFLVSSFLKPYTVISYRYGDLSAAPCPNCCILPISNGQKPNNNLTYS